MENLEINYDGRANAVHFWGMLVDAIQKIHIDISVNYKMYYPD
jgi:hypothetical protein